MKYWAIGISIFILFSACQTSEYEALVKQELETGVVYEETFLGLKNGLTKKAFYDECWQLNKQQLVSQGPDNNYAQYILDAPEYESDSLKKVKILFYGIFDDNDIMHGMDMKMSFVSWAPWNKKYYSDQLIDHMKQWYMYKYGKNEFIKISIKDNLEAWVKVDGNRQILMYPNGVEEVIVRIEDLRQKYSKS